MYSKARGKLKKTVSFNKNKIRYKILQKKAHDQLNLFPQLVYLNLYVHIFGLHEIQLKFFHAFTTL